jgi:hypothetical protein
MFQKELNYFDLNLKWNKSSDPEYPFQIDHNGHKLQVRLNDFPNEQMYSLIVDSEFLSDFDDWPKNWER